MAFLVRDIFKMDLLKEARIVAGKQGLDREIVWVNMMEIMDELNSLQKGELLITTGYGLNQQDVYKDLILNLQQRGLAAIAIQPGYYIEKIPSYIVEEGNRYGFPVIEIPKKITFSHITRNILKNIYSIRFSTNTDYNVINSDIEKCVKLGKVTEENKQNLLSLLNPPEEAIFYFLLLSVQHLENGIIAQIDIDTIINRICSYLKNFHNSLVVQEINGRIAILFITNKEHSTRMLSKELFEILLDLSKTLSKLQLIFTLSKSFEDCINLINAYDEAVEVMNVLIKGKVKKAVGSYENFPLIKFLCAVEDAGYAEKFMRDLLDPLIQHDSIHGSNYMHTLKNYLQTGCNMNVTSENLFIHRHTLRYRIEKIEQICDKKLDDYYTTLSFEIAFLLSDFYN